MTRQTKPSNFVSELLQRIVDEKSKVKMSIGQKQQETRNQKVWIEREIRAGKAGERAQREIRKAMYSGKFLVRVWDKTDKVLRAFEKVSRRGGARNDGMAQSVN